jgi:hypothetical protein
MTIEVYRINPQTGIRTLVRPKHTVTPADEPEYSINCPPCACPRCKGAPKPYTGVAEANRRSRGAL